MFSSFFYSGIEDDQKRDSKQTSEEPDMKDGVSVYISNLNLTLVLLKVRSD